MILYKVLSKPGDIRKRACVSTGSLDFEAPSIWKVPSFQLKRVTSTQQVYFETILNIQKLKENGLEKEWEKSEDSSARICGFTRFTGDGRIQ